MSYTSSVKTDMLRNMREDRRLANAELAGLLAAAIVTDTIVFKSPTSTPVDRSMAERMAKIAGPSRKRRKSRGVKGRRDMRKGRAEKPGFRWR